MKKTNIPNFDSIKEMAAFWDTHDVTDFADELEEVTETVFARLPLHTIAVQFQTSELDRIKHAAQSKGIQVVTLIRESVLEKIETC